MGDDAEAELWAERSRSGHREDREERAHALRRFDDGRAIAATDGVPACVNACVAIGLAWTSASSGTIASSALALLPRCSATE